MTTLCLLHWYYCQWTKRTKRRVLTEWLTFPLPPSPPLAVVIIKRRLLLHPSISLSFNCSTSINPSIEAMYLLLALLLLLLLLVNRVLLGCIRPLSLSLFNNSFPSIACSDAPLLLPLYFYTTWTRKFLINRRCCCSSQQLPATTRAGAAAAIHLDQWGCNQQHRSRNDQQLAFCPPIIRIPMSWRLFIGCGWRESVDGEKGLVFISLQGY